MYVQWRAETGSLVRAKEGCVKFCQLNTCKRRHAPKSSFRVWVFSLATHSTPTPGMLDLNKICGAENGVGIKIWVHFQLLTGMDCL